jgi:hypothetical protein
VVFSFWTSFPIIYIGLRYNIQEAILVSTIAITLTLIITVKENSVMFFLFHILPSLIIIYCSKHIISSDKKYNQINYLLLGITIYGSIIGLCSTFYFNRTISELYYITENFAKQNGIISLSIQPWISCIPGLFCIGNMGSTIINSIFAQKVLLYQQNIPHKYWTIEKLSIPDTLLVLLTILCAGSFILSGTLEIISKTLLFVFTFPYLIFSFTTIKLISNRAGSKKHLVLFITYTLIILLIWPLLIIIAISIFEPWIQIRKKIHKIN